MSAAERALREQLVAHGRRMEALRYVVGADGNLSCRFGDGMLITPTRMPYNRLEPADIVLVDGAGAWSGERAPSSEIAVHSAIYGSRPDVAAIVHAHPVYASVLAVRGTALPPLLDEVEPVLGGRIEVAEHAPSGGLELGERAKAALGDRHAVILARHGTVSTGSDLEEAFYRLEVLERAAQVFVLA